MNSKFLSRGRYVAVALFIALAFSSTAAFAVSVTFMASGTSGHTIYDSGGIGGTALLAGSYIQLIMSPDGTINPPGDVSGSTSGNDTILDSTVIGDGSEGVPGTFAKYIESVPNGSYVYVRAWDGGSPGAAGHYGDSNIKRVGISPPYPPEDFDVSNFATIILTDPPLIGSVTPDGEDHDDAVINVSIAAGYRVSTNTGYLSDHSYYLWYKKSDEDWGSAVEKWSNSLATTVSFALEGLDQGTTYNVRVKAANFFGESVAYGETSFSTLAFPVPVVGSASDLRIQLFTGDGSVTLTWNATDTESCEVYSTTEASGPYVYEATVYGPTFSYNDSSPGQEKYYRVKASNGYYALETVGKYTFNLIKTTTGINSVSFPLDTTVSGNTPNIHNALDVATNCPNFEFIGGWDESAQTEFGYLSSGTGDPDFPIIQGEGYQISVSTTSNWSIVGQK